MDSVTAWAATLCTAAVGCTALQMLAPKRGLGRIFQLITAAFFLCCMISPLLSMKNILSIDWNTHSTEVSSDELEQRVQQQFQSQVTAALTKTAEQILGEYDIPIAKIEANMDTDEQGSIYISKVVLYLSDAYRSQAAIAKQALKDGLGVDVSVIILTE